MQYWWQAKTLIACSLLFVHALVWLAFLKIMTLVFIKQQRFVFSILKKPQERWYTVSVAYLCPICYRCVWEVPVWIPRWVGKHIMLDCGAHWHLSAPQNLYKHLGCFSWSPEPRGPSQGQTHTQAYRSQNLTEQKVKSVLFFGQKFLTELICSEINNVFSYLLYLKQI